MRLLAIDLGERRIGLAAADTDARVAVPVGAIDRAAATDPCEAVAEAARARGADAVVVGLPVLMSGAAGAQAREAREFAALLAERTGLSVPTWDERLSSVEAERRLREAPGRRRKPKPGEQDAMAAAVVLQAYLDANPQLG